MPVRVTRMIAGMTEVPSVMVGRMKLEKWSEPEIGSQRNVTPKTMMRMRPNQKLGTAWPKTASPKEARSIQLLGFVAASTPSGIAMTSA